MGIVGEFHKRYAQKTDYIGLSEFLFDDAQETSLTPYDFDKYGESLTGENVLVGDTFPLEAIKLSQQSDKEEIHGWAYATI